MDKMVDPILQDIPRRLPTGLRSIGVGFGAGGQPLLNIGEISSELFRWILFATADFCILYLLENGRNEINKSLDASAIINP